MIMSAFFVSLLVVCLVTTSINNAISLRSLFKEHGLPDFQVTAGTTSVDIQFSNGYSSYMVMLNNQTWLTSGTTFFRNKGKVATMVLNSTAVNGGEDSFGQFSQLVLVWSDSANAGTMFATIFRQYPMDPDLVQFIQVYLSGATGATTKNSGAVISAFPSFKLQNGANNRKLGYVHWSGGMAGDGPQFGVFEQSSSSLNGGIQSTGPLAIYDSMASNCIVISALTDHMAASDYVTSSAGFKEIQWGLQGNIDVVEPGFAVAFILSVTRNGGSVNAGMRQWGDRQLQFYDKPRGNAHMRDFTLNYLGYSTDNGAFYYYHTEPNKNYQQTMIDVQKYHASLKLPTRWVLLDSWWYYQGSGGGVKNWTARPDIFPGGMEAVHAATGWYIQAHNRYFSLDNVYANNIPDQKEVGNYPFTWGASHYSLPTTYSFWDHLFNINRNWGLIVYEQDWLSTTEVQIPLILNSTTFGRQWLMNMGNAAAFHDLSIQYCMDYPRHLMSSVELRCVTQARASGDYHPGNTQWKLGITAVFTSAIEIMPSKDSYWSMNSPQAGHYSAGTHEPYNRLQSAVQSLGNGPVTFADRIGYSDADLIMRCCNADGLLLRPDMSATMIDAYFEYRAGIQTDSSKMSSGEIWSTSSLLNHNEMHRYFYLFAVELDKPLMVYPSDVSYLLNSRLGPHLATEWLVYEANKTSTFFKFDSKTPLTVGSRGKDNFNFELFTMIPISPNNTNGWYLQGETGKWITASQQRFKELTVGDGELFVRIFGAVGEKVSVSFVNYHSMQTQAVQCTVGETQQVMIKMPAATCQAY
jgi:hypothetical protein